MKMTRATMMTAAGMLGTGLLLTGCAEAQQAIDGAQSVVATAQVLIQACSEASVAWSPDASVADATAGLQSAMGNVDEALAADPSLPGAASLLSSLESALVDLENAQESAAAMASTAAVKSACALVGG